MNEILRKELIKEYNLEDINYMDYENGNITITIKFDEYSDMMSYLKNLHSDSTGLKDKYNVGININDIINHNGNLYVARKTENHGIVFISGNTFNYSKLLLESHRWRSFNWAYRVQKYISVVGTMPRDKDLLSSVSDKPEN